MFIFKNKIFIKILEVNLNRDFFIENWVGRNYFFDWIFFVCDYVIVVIYFLFVNYKFIL